MDGQKIEYEMQFLQTALENIDKQLDAIALRMKNGTILAHRWSIRTRNSPTCRNNARIVSI